MYKKHYSRFLAARPNLLHCAPHSHYYWPDVTREAQLRYWDDSAMYADEKWGYMFSEKVPAVQQGIARILNVANPEQIVFAPNTHELLYRAISTFEYGRKLAILTTDAEFHSFNRQSRRLEERGNVEVVRIATEPFATFASRWLEAVGSRNWDMIFISQVFYNSGVAAPLPNEWLHAVQAADCLIMVDGYHGFAAVPTDWSAYTGRVFYLAGAYKYGQAGEGCCFAVVPSRAPEQPAFRPEYTGWFADFASLEKSQAGPVEYTANGMAMAGATIDLSALYRFEAVLSWWQQQQLTPQRINEYIRLLQQAFLTRLDELNDARVNRTTLLENGLDNHGHFFTFRWKSVGNVANEVADLAKQLKKRGIATDYRNDRLRFGFALYHNADDYQRISFD